MTTPRQQIDAMVTGGTGFIGAYLLEHLLSSNLKVVAIVREASLNSSRLPRHDNLIVISGDIEHLEKSWDALKQFEPKVFYHLAYKGVANHWRNAELQLDNIQSSLHTLKLAKALNCKRWLCTGSQAEYGPVNRRIAETEATHPTTLYGATKLSINMLSQIFAKQYNMETIWVRLFSIYGAGDNGGWLLTDLIKTLLAKKRPQLTLGEQLWDYLYVTDAAEGIASLGNSEQASGTFNLGSGRSQTIRSIVEMVRDLIDPTLPLGFGEVPYRPDQTMHLEADINKIQSVTGWSPKVDLPTGLKQMIAYSKTNFNINNRGEANAKYF